MLWIIPLIAIIIYIFLETAHRKTAYYSVTKTPLLLVWANTGRLGEYMTYKYLQHYEKAGAKFLFNTYIPKCNDETTEIDVLMINQNGIFVFESKNYSGWIFGNEHQKNWYQTLPQGKGRSHKESFYNPVMQNKSHIKHLASLVGSSVPMHSIITFSERCTLKKVEITSPDVYVINRNNVVSTVASITEQHPNIILNCQQINSIYDLLFPYTQVDSRVKTQHIANIENAQASVQLKRVSTEKAEVADSSKATFDPAPSLSLNKQCPKCGGNLVLRTTKKGPNAGQQFYGCSNYPKCHHTEQIPHTTD